MAQLEEDALGDVDLNVQEADGPNTAENNPSKCGSCKQRLKGRANPEATMAGRPIPFRTGRFTPIRMLQRPVLLTHDGQCRAGVLLCLYHRIEDTQGESAQCI